MPSNSPTSIRHASYTGPGSVKANASWSIASHAVTPDIGQGACLAIEDAVVLAAELERGDVPRALRAYDAARRGRTARAARQSGQIGRMLMRRNRFIASVRDTAASVVPATIALKSIGDLYGWVAPPLPELRVR